MRVKWNNTLYCEFVVKNGVKQGEGGSISIVICCIYRYIDELLLQLQTSRFGSYIGQYFVGALAYGDDVALLDPTLTSITPMLHVVKVFAHTFGVVFNASKTKLINLELKMPPQMRFFCSMVNVFNVIFVHVIWKV